jgi:hypothetical protein
MKERSEIRNSKKAERTKDLMEFMRSTVKS